MATRIRRLTHIQPVSNGNYYVVRTVGMVRYLFPVLAVIGILNVVNGKAKKLPVIGEIL